jgi:membrane fusion protein, multidrug efflux system
VFSLISKMHCLPSAAMLSVLLLVVGCDQPSPQPLPPTPVNVANVEQRDVTVSTEYVGELASSQQVSLRARTSGILLQQHVPDGAKVAKGELLFSIDPREAIEQREAARAQLAAAQAQLLRAQADVARYQPLLADEAIARQVYDNAVAAAKAAKAAVDAQNALLRQAELGIEYAEVVAPLDGRMGAARVAVGDLISTGVTILAEVAVDDPLWVYVNPSETDLLAYERRLRERPETVQQLANSAILLLGDDREYALPGRINFTDRALDPGTGTYRLRVEFPNPEGRLLAGQFSRIRLQTDVFKAAIVVPAKAVLQVLDQAFVGVLLPDQTVEQRPVVLGQRIDSDWIISAGLQAGETIVVDGLQKIRPGSKVQAQPIAASNAATL